MYKYYPFKIIVLCFLICMVYTRSLGQGAVSLSKSGIFTANYITYTFTINNTGLTVINSILLSDAKIGLSNYAIAVPVGGLLPGGVTFFSTRYILSQADKDASLVNNTATLTCIDALSKTLTSTASVTVLVSKSPEALDDAGTTIINQPVTINVLQNDNPGSSSFDLRSLVIITMPADGTVRVNGDGSVTYTPKPFYNGPDKFTYRVQDMYGYYTNVATVTIIQTLVAGALRVPNLFTPNGDGINDTFEIRGIGQYYSNEVTIVNRWGNQVFHSNNYQNNWNGNGLNEGTYFYVVKVQREATTDPEIYKGYVTLARPH